MEGAKIPGFPGYYTDGFGGVFSDKRGKMKKLSQQRHKARGKKMYRRVKVHPKLQLVHRLMGAVLIGRPLLPSEVVNHLDGDTENNNLSNLEVTTHKQNVKHAVCNGLYCSGDAWHAARRS